MYILKANSLEFFMAIIFGNISPNTNITKDTTSTSNKIRADSLHSYSSATLAVTYAAKKAMVTLTMVFPVSRKTNKCCGESNTTLIFSGVSFRCFRMWKYAVSVPEKNADSISNKIKIIMYSTA